MFVPNDQEEEDLRGTNKRSLGRPESLNVKAASLETK